MLQFKDQGLGNTDIWQQRGVYLVILAVRANFKLPDVQLTVDFTDGRIVHS